MSNPNNDREKQDEPEGGRHLDGVGVLQIILVVVVVVVFVVSDVVVVGSVIIADVFSDTAVVVAIEARFGKDKLLHLDGVQVL